MNVCKKIHIFIILGKTLPSKKTQSTTFTYHPAGVLACTYLHNSAEASLEGTLWCHLDDKNVSYSHANVVISGSLKALSSSYSSERSRKSGNTAELDAVCFCVVWFKNFTRSMGVFGISCCFPMGQTQNE